MPGITLEGPCNQVMSDRVLMPPTLPAGAAGIVLVWNPRISDMDIHMMTPWRCHVYWNNKVCLGPQPWTLHPTPYALHPAPYTLQPTPYTLHPVPYTLHPEH